MLPAEVHNFRLALGGLLVGEGPLQETLPSLSCSLAACIVSALSHARRLRLSGAASSQFPPA